MGKGRASASFASSFASAMLRSIHRLSASLTISAASGELSVITSIVGIALRQKSAQASPASASRPPTRIGIEARSRIAWPSASRSGLKAMRTCAFGAKISSCISRVVPGGTVLLIMTSWPSAT